MHMKLLIAAASLMAFSHTAIAAPPLTQAQYNHWHDRMVRDCHQGTFESAARVCVCIEEFRVGMTTDEWSEREPLITSICLKETE
jgi:hypothetical protein